MNEACNSVDVVAEEVRNHFKEHDLRATFISVLIDASHQIKLIAKKAVCWHSKSELPSNNKRFFKGNSYKLLCLKRMSHTYQLESVGSVTLNNKVRKCYI